MGTRQGFGKNISEIVTARDELDPQSTPKNTAPHIMVVNLNVFGSGMKHRIRGQSNSRVVITPKYGDVRKKQLKFFEECAKPS